MKKFGQVIRFLSRRCYRSTKGGIGGHPVRSLSSKPVLRVQGGNRNALLNCF
jgi:hypothetical protein